MLLAFTAAVMLMEIAGRFVAVFTVPVLSTSIDSVFGFVGMATMFMGAVSSSKGIPTALSGGVGGGHNPLKKSGADKKIEEVVKRTGGVGGTNGNSDPSNNS